MNDILRDYNHYIGTMTRIKEEINRFTDNTINNRTYLTIFETRETYATLLKELNEERDELIKCIDQLQKMNYDEPFFDYKQLYKDLKFANTSSVFCLCLTCWQK